MNEQWWKHALIYQIYPRSFFDSNDDGIGDLWGITQKLDYVAALGVDAVWISPFYRSPMEDFGYDISDYRAVDPIFGTLDDFRELLEKAHGLGLKVLIDQVWCHTSDQHPWFAQSASSRDNPKSDWYVWADAKEDGSVPNNWLATFGGPAWSWNPERQQYYLHHFLPQQPALNWYNPDVQAALLDVGRFWLDMGVDGFRFDVINFLMHDRQLRDNPRRPASAPLPAGGHPDIPFFGFLNTYNIGRPETYTALHAIRRLLDGYDARTSLAEISCAEDALFEAQKAVGTERLHLSYNSSLITEEPLGAAHMRDILTQAEGLIADGGICWTAGTHDFPRLASRWHEHLLKHENFNQDAFNFMIAVLLISLPGACCFYQGDELGLPEAELLYEDIRDPFGLRHYPDFLGRDGCRTPLPWKARKPHFGFTRAERAWLPVYSGHEILSIDRQEGLRDSLLNRYRRLIRWRSSHDALRRSMSLRLIDVAEDLLVYVRGDETEQPLLFVLNMAEEPVRLPRRSLPACEPLAQLNEGGVDVSAAHLNIAAYGFWIGTVQRAGT
jgi:alpha-glucosidase